MTEGDFTSLLPIMVEDTVSWARSPDDAIYKCVWLLAENRLSHEQFIRLLVAVEADTPWTLTVPTFH